MEDRRIAGSVGLGTSQSAGLGDSQGSVLGDPLGTGFPIPSRRAECLTLYSHGGNAPTLPTPYKSGSGVTA